MKTLLILLSIAVFSCSSNPVIPKTGGGELRGSWEIYRMDFFIEDANQWLTTDDPGMPDVSGKIIIGDLLTITWYYDNEPIIDGITPYTVVDNIFAFPTEEGTESWEWELSGNNLIFTISDLERPDYQAIKLYCRRE